SRRRIANRDADTSGAQYATTRRCLPSRGRLGTLAPRIATASASAVETSTPAGGRSLMQPSPVLVVVQRVDGGAQQLAPLVVQAEQDPPHLFGAGVAECEVAVDQTARSATTPARCRRRWWGRSPFRRCRLSRCGRPTASIRARRGL